MSSIYKKALRWYLFKSVNAPRQVFPWEADERWWERVRPPAVQRMLRQLIQRKPLLRMTIDDALPVTDPQLFYNFYIFSEDFEGFSGINYRSRPQPSFLLLLCCPIVVS